jgi:hypothetical protein
MTGSAPIERTLMNSHGIVLSSARHGYGIMKQVAVDSQGTVTYNSSKYRCNRMDAPTRPQFAPFVNAACEN